MTLTVADDGPHGAGLPHGDQWFDSVRRTLWVNVGDDTEPDWSNVLGLPLDGNPGQQLRLQSEEEQDAVWFDDGPGVLEDPEATWQPDTEYVIYQRISVPNGDETAIVRVTNASGMSGFDVPEWDFTTRLAITEDGQLEWTWLGNLGQVSWMQLPVEG